MPEFKSKYLSSFIWGVNWDDGIFFGKKKNWRKWLFLRKQFLKEYCEWKKKQRIIINLCWMVKIVANINLYSPKMFWEMLRSIFQNSYLIERILATSSSSPPKILKQNKDKEKGPKVSRIALTISIQMQQPKIQILALIFFQKLSPWKKKTLSKISSQELLIIFCIRQETKPWEKVY